METWKYYNHAAIPSVPPYKIPNFLPLENKSIWRIGKKKRVFLARWVTDWDCDYETNWWYIIKDAQFDISKLKAKRRYEINKGVKNFEVKEINPYEYKEELYAVQIAAFSAYPAKYRPRIKRENFMAEIDKWNQYTILGVFARVTKELVGYALLSKKTSDYVEFNVLKVDPKYEKQGCNAALVEGVLRYFNDFLLDGGFISDGARNINHETGFQDYLEKYFGFRKAYCHLHITYNPQIKWLIKVLFPLRKILRKFDFFSIIHQVNAILKMEELIRGKK